MSIKFTQLPLGAALNGSEIIADVQSGVSVQHNLNQVFTFISSNYVYGNGLTFNTGTKTLSVNINTQNLKFDTGVLNTIQDINILASPTFRNLTLDSPTSSTLSITTNSTSICPLITLTCNTNSIGSPFGLSTIQSNGRTQLGTLYNYAVIGTSITNITDLNPAGGLTISVLEGVGVPQTYLSLDGSVQRIKGLRTFENLVGYQSFPEKLFITSNQNINTNTIGKTLINNTASNLTLTLTLNDGLPANTAFDMLTNGSGSFAIQAQSGVTLNGVNAGSFIIGNQFKRISVTKIATNNYTYVEYSGSGGGGGSGDFQDVYNASLGNTSFIQFDNQPFEIRNSSGIVSYSFGSDVSSNTNTFQLNNSFGDIDIIKQNLSPSNIQNICYDRDIALNDASNTVLYVEKVSSVRNPGVGTESGQYVINIQDPVLSSLKTYLSLDGETRTVKVPNNTTKILEPVATISDISNVSLQSAYNDGSTIQLDGINDIVIYGVGVTEMFRFDNSLSVISSVPLYVDNLLTVQSDSLLSPANISITMNPLPGVSNVIGDITFDSLDSSSSGVQYSKFETSIGSSTVGSRSSLISLYAYFNDLQQSIFIYNGTDNSTKIRVPGTNILDQIATVGEIPSLVSLQIAYNAGQTITLNGLNDLVIYNNNLTPMFRYDNSFLVTSYVPMEVLDSLTVRSDTTLIPGFVSVGMNPTPSSMDIIGEFTIEGLDTASNQIEYGKIEAIAGDPMVGTRYSLMSMYAYFDDNQQSIFVYNGLDNSTKIRDPNTGLLKQISTSGDVSLQDAYNNGNGTITLISEKPFKLISTVAGFVPSSMSNLEGDAIVNPDNGLMFWNNDINRIRVNKGSPISVLYDDVAYLSDITNALSSNYGEMYFNGNINDETVIVSPATPVKVVGTYLSGLLDNFSQLNGTLTWTGLDTKVFRVSATVTLTPDLTTDTFTVFIAQNGVVVGKSQESAYFGPTVPAQKEVSVQCLLSLDSLDTVEIFVQNDNTTNNVTITSLNCALTDATGTFDTGNVTLQTAYASGNGEITLNNNKPFGLNGLGGMFLNSVTEAQFLALPVIPNSLMAWDIEDNRIVVNKGTQISPVIDKVAYISDIVGGTIIDSGSSGLSVLSEFGVNGTSIISQLFEKIDNVTHYNASLNFTPTSTVGLITLQTSAVNNIVNVCGTGSLSVLSTNSIISPIGVQPLGICTVPKTNYTVGVAASMASTLAGTNTIPANSLVTGDQICISAQGYANSVGSGGSGQLTINIGGQLLVFSTVFNATNSGTQPWKLDFYLTIVSPTTARASAVGYRIRPNGDFEYFDFGGISQVFFIDLSVPITFDLRYLMVTATTRYELVADSLVISKVFSPSRPIRSSEVRTFGYIAGTKNITLAFTISEENLNVENSLNVSFSYEE